MAAGAASHRATLEDTSGDEASKGADSQRAEASHDIYLSMTREAQVNSHDEAVCLDAEFNALFKMWTRTNPEAAAVLGRVLFPDRNQTVLALRELLTIRNVYMKKKNIPDKDRDGQKPILNDAERAEILAQWKREYHSRPDQVELQKRDSHLPRGGRSGAYQPAGGKASGASPPGSGKGIGDSKGGRSKGGRAPRDEHAAEEWGPNNKRVLKGKRSRWCRHLQREFGSKRIAEVIVFYWQRECGAVAGARGAA